MTADVVVDPHHVPIPHRPAQLKLVEDAINLEQLVFVSPVRLPTERPFGPQRPQRAWSTATVLAESALRAAKVASVSEAEAVLGVAYRKFANVAELEIAEQTDTVLVKTGRRGALPVPRWVKVVQTRGKVDVVNEIAEGWAWLTSALKELARLATGVRDEPEQVIFKEQLESMRSGTFPGDGLCSRLDAYVKAAKAMATQCPEAGAADVVWQSDVNDILDDFEAEAAAVRERAAEHRQLGWSTWLNESFKGGARAMHRYTRLAEEWAPAVVTRGARISAAPQGVLEAEADTLAQHWRAESTPRRVCVPNRDAFPRAESKQIRAALLSFSAMTSQSIDGFHPRQVALLSMMPYSAWPSCMRPLSPSGSSHHRFGG